MSTDSRDNFLLKSRPVIKCVKISNTEQFIIEDFQNKVLRPILKFQNDLLINLFIKYSHNKKQVLKILELEAKEKVIDDNFKKNSSLRQLLLGSVIAFFTSDEFITYDNFTYEINKRIFSMLKARLKDQLIYI
mgnify:CR=1 FL=1